MTRWCAADDQGEARKARAERTLKAYVEHFRRRPDIANDDAWKFECLTGHRMIKVCYRVALGNYKDLLMVLRTDMPVTDVVARLEGALAQLWPLDMRRLTPLALEATRVEDAEKGTGRLVFLGFDDAVNLERPGLMRCFVKTLTGDTIHLSLATTDTVEHAKHVVRFMYGTPEEDQRLLFAGKQLEDGRPLDHYGIHQECTLHLVLRMRGC